MHWPDFNRPPSRDAVWGWITLLFFLPLVSELSTFVLLYVLAVLAVRWRFGAHEKGWVYLGTLFAGLGIVALEFLREFTFVSLSQASVFITLVASLLTVGVVMAVLQGRRSFYLDISPAMFWVLSFFYHEDLGMLFYSIAALFGVVTLLLWAQMRESLKSAARLGALFILATLPVVVLLFALFPRIHFAKADFGFTDKHAKRMGHDGRMEMGDDAVLFPSKRIVMEVGFEEEVPPDRSLYFRGSVLYSHENGVWLPISQREPLSVVDSRGLTRTSEAVDYRVTLYPHHKRWLYVLDMPGEIPKNVHADEDFVLQTKKPLTDVYIYPMRSYLDYRTETRLNTVTRAFALAREKGANPKTEALVDTLTSGIAQEELKAERLMEYFATGGFSYTLRPDRLEGGDRIDGFLFDSKRGYCVHYSAAFVTMARMAGIPARVVTGFKASRHNSIENYLVVREEDAHAWTELFFEGAGWVRFDPTTQIAMENADGVTSAALAAFRPGKEQGRWERFNLYWMYWRYQIEQWVLYYSRYKQNALVESIRQNSKFGVAIAVGFGLLVLTSLALSYLLRRRRYDDASLRAMQRLWKSLEKEGMKKPAWESASSFLRRLASENPERADAFSALAELLERWRYDGLEPKKSELRRLAGEIRK